jgi:hypothetical protein
VEVVMIDAPNVRGEGAGGHGARACHATHHQGKRAGAPPMEGDPATGQRASRLDEDSQGSLARRSAARFPEVTRRRRSA